MRYRTLFSGGELFGCGAQAAGWLHEDGYEWDAKIAAVANLNGFRVHVADVRAVDYEHLAPVDHLHMLPVCKRASVANTDAEESEEDLETAEACIRAIRAHTGRSASLENVWPYRNFESFKKIESALQAEGFALDVRHINAADFGVPQTRKRLILRAVRRSWRENVPPLTATHQEGGDMFSPPWVGWYEAIEDLIPFLPETQPAAWQLARLPKVIRESTLMHGTSTLELRPAGAPAATVVATVGRKAIHPRAYLLDGTAGADGSYLAVRSSEAPCGTVHAQAGARHVMRAFLMQSKNSSQEWGDGTRDYGEPAFTVVTDRKPSHQPLAYLTQLQPNARGDWRTPEEPSKTINAQDAVIQQQIYFPPGRWVKLTVQALGRFQTVPDWYQDLTAEINGNGVPCLLARRIMESLS